MKISDRAIGYFSFIALIVLIAVIALGMWDAHRATKHTITADFTELGSLQPEDEVTIRGYHVGTVYSVTWLGDRSRVVMQFDEPLRLREGTEIRDVNYALMGQRRIEIYPSKTGKNLPDDYVFQGVFEPGIAEALRLIEDAIAQVESVRQMILLVANGDSTHASFTSVFEESMQKVEALLKKAETLSVQVPEQINSILATTDSASRTVVNISEEASKTINAIDSAVTDKVNTANEALATIKDGAATADSVFDLIESNELVKTMLDSDTLVRETEKLIAQLQDFIKVLDTKGLDVRDDNGNVIPLLTWRNINIIGATAREKARKRAELEAKLKN